MSLFGKPKGQDEELSRQFVQRVFAIGRETCPVIAEAIQLTEGDVTFPLTDEASLEISLAILGTSLAVLKDNSPVMTPERAAEVEAFCKRSIQADYKLTADSADKLNSSLDVYQDAYQGSVANKSNPFGDISGSGMPMPRSSGVSTMSARHRFPKSIYPSGHW